MVDLMVSLLHGAVAPLAVSIDFHWTITALVLAEATLRGAEYSLKFTFSGPST